MLLACFFKNTGQRTG